MPSLSTLERTLSITAKQLLQPKKPSLFRVIGSNLARVNSHPELPSLTLSRSRSAPALSRLFKKHAEKNIERSSTTKITRRRSRTQLELKLDDDITFSNSKFCFSPILSPCKPHRSFTEDDLRSPLGALSLSSVDATKLRSISEEHSSQVSPITSRAPSPQNIVPSLDFSFPPHRTPPLPRMHKIKLLEGVSKPLLVRDETGGSHIFKASDQEPFKIQKDRSGIETRVCKKKGIEHGHASKKEVAAFLLDRGLAGVPHTSLSTISLAEEDMKEESSNVHIGSLQKHVPNLGTTDDFSPSLFSTKDVHNIGLLDIRLCNLDRHLGNMLVVGSNDSDRKNLSLVPIDHAYSLPHFLETSDVNLEWLYWKQTEKPFDQSTLRNIENLDPMADAAVLKKLGLRDGAIVTMILTTNVLKLAALKGMNLFQIGSLLQRKDFGEEPSAFETLVNDVWSQFCSRCKNTSDNLRNSIAFVTKSGSFVPNKLLNDFLAMFQQRLESVSTSVATRAIP